MKNVLIALALLGSTLVGCAADPSRAPADVAIERIETGEQVLEVFAERDGDDAWILELSYWDGAEEIVVVTDDGHRVLSSNPGYAPFGP